MNLNKIFVPALLLGVSFFQAQKIDTIHTKSFRDYPVEMRKIDEYGTPYIYDPEQKAKIYEINNETIVVIDEIMLTAKPHFNNELDRNYYMFLNKKLSRVYPLFLKALAQYNEIQAESATMTDDNRRKFMKQKQEELANQYEAQLRDLTTTEGRVFAKLMYRATGKTVFDIIKELRGGWSAFWWNVKGKIADVDIKEVYNPHKDRTDQFLEDLLYSNWTYGYLQPYPGYKNFKVPKD